MREVYAPGVHRKRDGLGIDGLAAQLCVAEDREHGLRVVALALRLEDEGRAHAVEEIRQHGDIARVRDALRNFAILSVGSG